MGRPATNKMGATLPSGCVLFGVSYLPSGHGRVRFAGKLWLAHRLSYMWFYGVDPGELCVCHTCDTPLCINPKHLFLGTQLDNVADMVAKNRQNPKARFCLRGHDTDVVGRGPTSRMCHACDALRSQRRHK